MDGAFADKTGFADSEMFMEEIAAGDELISGRLESANISTEGGGNEGATDAHEASDDFVGGHFGGRPAELEKIGIDVVADATEEIERFEPKIGESDAEVELVELIETEEHDGGGAIKEEEKFVSISDGLFEVETAFANVNFDEGVYRIENVPLSISDELDKSEGEGVFGAKIHGVTEAKEENKERSNVTDEIGGIVFEAVGEIEAKTEFVAVFGKNDDSIERHYGAGNRDDDGLVLGEEGGADENAEIEDVKGGGVAVGAGVLVFEVEFFEDERENRLNDENENGIDGKSVIDSGVHVHEGDKGVDIEDGETINEESESDANYEARHGGVFVFIFGLADVGAGSEGAADDTVNTLEWVSDGEDADETFVDD